MKNKLAVDKIYLIELYRVPAGHRRRSRAIVLSL